LASTIRNLMGSGAPSAVTASAREARHFHEDAEGYDRGDAHAERVQALLPELLVDEGWKDGPEGELQRGPNWPSDELLIACGGEIASQSRESVRDSSAIWEAEGRLAGG
jgi:hypothetical protein